MTGLAELFRHVRQLGAAGVQVPLTLRRDGELLHVRLRSADRGGFLKKPQLQ